MNNALKTGLLKVLREVADDASVRAVVLTGAALRPVRPGPAASKRLLAASSRPLAETLRAEAAEQIALGMTRDHLTAVSSFLAREEPMFTGLCLSRGTELRKDLFRYSDHYEQR
ncbi:Clp protease/crotonase-like domain-containing protein [Thermomonospora echinospora]|uniref:hypothetical protein n=1 Tax=Thermomonospora echinospora TaxID=1992 RepID=UPI00190EB71B|nr:hypothetical protein [Thermomonospora echinospora]